MCRFRRRYLHISSFSKPHISKNPYSLVYCGACVGRKNLFFLIDIFDALYSYNNQFTLTIIGDGPLLFSLKQYSKQRHLPVFYKGRLDRVNLLEQFSTCSICLHTSTKESFSFSLLEAKLLGLTTVAYGGLEVPSEFIDIPVSSFDKGDWVSSTLTALNVEFKPDLSMYSSDYMARRLISIAS